MKSVFRIMSVAGLVLGLALAGLPASAQQPAAPPLKPASPAAIAAALLLFYATRYGLRESTR